MQGGYSTKLYNTLMGNPNAGNSGVYNAVGRTAGRSSGGDNFFVKRGKSIENAIGTTLSVLPSLINDANENTAIDERLNKFKQNMNDIYTKYGYNNADEYYDAKHAAEKELFGKYGYDIDAFDDKKAAIWSPKMDAETQKKVDALEAERENVINGMSAEDAERIRKFDNIQNELKGQSAANAEEQRKASEDYADYRNNSYIGQKINQDNGKFLGSAINTMSTALDLTGLTANPLANAIQGAVEGYADELEENGGTIDTPLFGGKWEAKNWDKFDINRANQNALIGGVTGGITGGLNAGINKSLAKKNGKLFTGGNALTRGINNFNANTALGRVGSTIGSGAARGAVSGAVGGGVGAGISAAMNGQDVLGSAVEGAKRGAAQGAFTGGVMSGANMLPGIKQMNQKFNEANKNWENSGDSFKERWANTRAEDTWGNRFINKTVDTAKSVGEGFKDVGKGLSAFADEHGVGLSIKDVSSADNTNDVGSKPTIDSAPEEKLQSYKAQTSEVDPWDRIAQQKGYNNYDEVIQRYMEANPDVELNPRGAAGQILTWLDQNPNTPTTASGWFKKAGDRVINAVNKHGLGLSIKDVGDSQDYSDDINKMYVNRNDMLNYKDDGTEPISVEEALGGAARRSNTQNTQIPEIEEPQIKTNTTKAKSPETEVYDALTGNKTGTERQLRNAAGLKLQQQYGAVDKPTAKATNAPETLQKIAKAGFTKPADVERMADVVTGSNGEVSKLVSNLVSTADPVDTFAGETDGQTLDDYINLAIDKRGLNGINEGKAVKSQINALMRSLPSRAEGSITYKDDPTDVFKLTQLLDSEAAQYEGRSGMNHGTTTPDKLRAAQVIKDVSNLFKDHIYSTVDVGEALTPEVAQNLKSYAPNNKDWANYVDNEIMNAQNVKDLRSVQAPWVRAKKIIDNGYMNSVTYGGRNGGSGFGIPLTKRGLTGAILGATVNSDAGLRLQARALNKAADIAAKAPNDGGEATTDTTAQMGNPAPMDTDTAQTGLVQVSNPAMNMYNAIGRNEGLSQAQQARTADYLAQANQSQKASSLEDFTGASLTGTPTSATALYNTTYGTPMDTTANMAGTQTVATGNSYFPATGDYWTDVIGRAMTSAIDRDDVESFAALYEMYQDALSRNSSKSSGKDYSDVTNWNSADRTKLLSAQNAMDQIDQLENAYNTATGGNGSNMVQGWLRSRAADISGGNLDPSAANYNSLAQSVGMGIVKNLINLGVTEADAKRYLEYLPALTDTKEQATQKLATLRNIYQSQINNLYSAYGM